MSWAVPGTGDCYTSGGRVEGLRPQRGPLKPGCGRKTHKEEPVLFADHWEGIVNDIRTKGNSGLKS